MEIQLDLMSEYGATSFYSSDTNCEASARIPLSVEGPYALDDLPEAQSTIWMYDYAENDQSTYEWIESRQSSDLRNILPVPSPVKARILLLEGLTKGSIDACCSQLGVPQEFFIYHKSESARARTINTTGSKHFLSAKWSRLVNQSPDLWEIESRIRKGTPYSLDTSKDPQFLRLDHERYQQVPTVFRPYCAISQTPKGILQQLARENISLFWRDDDPSLFGIMNYDSCAKFHLLTSSVVLVVVDPKRKYYITKKKYKLWGTELPESSTIESCFLDEVDGYAKVRFIEELRRHEERTLMDDFIHEIQNIITHIMVTNTTQILISIHDSLDKIDLSLSNDDVLRNSLPIWRERFGLWRQDLLRSLVSVKEILKTFNKHKSYPNYALQPSSTSMLNSKELELGGLQADLDDALTRLTSTFNSVMSTISIVESQKAILEAEAVSKLTALAFFFIPLGFVASLFGMNLVVSFSYYLLSLSTIS
jgi:CorA-like Mg2+ transporter protein